jgi:hypothetical protein
MGDHDGLESVITIGWNAQPWCIPARSGLPLASVEAVQAEQIVDRDPELFGEVTALDERSGRYRFHIFQTCW